MFTFLISIYRSNPIFEALNEELNESEKSNFRQLFYQVRVVMPKSQNADPKKTQSSAHTFRFYFGLYWLFLCSNLDILLITHVDWLLFVG